MIPPTSGSRPTVAVWRSDWLAYSETFIAQQMAAMSRWRPFPIGLRKVPGGLSVPGVYAPFDRRTVSRVAHRVSSSIAYRIPFDAQLRRQGARVIHAHFGPGAVRVLPIARRTGLPLIVTFHGFDVTGATSGQSANVLRYRSHLQEVFHYASRLIAVSEFIAGRLVALGAPAEKVQVQHIGIPVDRDGAPPEPLQTRPGGVIFVGRLVAQKGPEHLLAAVERLARQSGLRIPITMVGAGPLLVELQDKARTAGLAVEFTGRLHSDEVAAQLSRSRIFCGPSVTYNGSAEGLGMVFLEAGLHGLPVVAYESGGIGEAVLDGRTGLLASEGDVDGLADRIRTLWNNPQEAGSLGAAGRQRVIADFDVQRCTRSLERVYDEVAGEASEE